MNRLFGPVGTRAGVGLAVLRIVTGGVFFAHGWQKVFGFGIGGIQGGFSQMGIPLAPLAAPFVSFLELIGGVLLVLGVLTRPLAALFVIEMLVAIVAVHLPAGFFSPKGFEFPLLLAAASLCLAVAGPGRLSVDAIIDRRRGTAP